jgi:hypothetical protein
MTQHFTTPEFVRTLKQQGIEIDSCFVILMFDDENYTVALKDNEGSCVDINGYKHWLADFSDVLPAYPVTQVLGWLPESLIFKDVKCKYHTGIHKGVFYIGYSGENEERKVDTILTTVELFFTDLLTEGWLNKDNLTLTT